jgi:hypothetical protein
MAISYQRKLGDGTIVIDSNTSNVGIGTNDPESRLHVTGTGSGTFRAESTSSDYPIRISGHQTTADAYIGVDVSNKLKFYVNSGDRMVINSSGNVGIGETSPSNRLHIKHNSNAATGILVENSLDNNGTNDSDAAAQISFQVASNNGYLRVHGSPTDVASEHQIDLGSTASGSFLTFSPSGSEKLRVKADGTIQFNTYGAGVLTTDSAGNVGVSTGYQTQSTADGRYVNVTGDTMTGQLIIQKTGNFTAAKFKGTAADGYGQINVENDLGTGLILGSMGSTKTGTFFDNARYIGATSGELVLKTYSSTDGHMKFLSGGQNERMRITAGGNVGIGNTNPTNKLRVDASAGQATTLANSITNAAVYINSDTANGSNNIRIGESGSGSYFLQVSNSAGTTPYAINLNPFGGDVGIGTTSPSTKLHVAGDITLEDSGTPIFKIYDSGNGGGGGAAGIIQFANNDGDAIGIGYTGSVTTTSDLIISTNAGSTYGGYLGLDAAAIADPSSIILDPKTSVIINGDAVIGEHRIIDLPSFNMGASSVTDEYLVVCKQAPSGGGVDASGIQGRISFSRGSSGSFNNSQYIDINIQMSLDSGSVNNLDVTQFELYRDSSNAFFSQLEEIDIDGTKYVALKARASGGGETNHFYFEGSISDASDTNILSRVRASDSTVTVTDPQPTGFPITPYITKNQDGNVGIGTTDPSTNLEVAGAVKVTDSASGVTIGGVGHASLRLNRASTSYDNNILFNTNGDTKFRIWQDGNADYLYIRDDDNATNMVTFKKGGNVGIGTTDPSRDLHIVKSNDGGQVRFQIINTSNTADSTSVISIYNGGADGGDPFLHWKIDVQQDWSMGIDNSDGDKLKISKNFGPGTNDYLTVDTSGNVGIGTTAPGEKLVIAGGVLAYGNTSSIGSGTSYYLGNNPNSRDIVFTRVANAELGIGRYNGGWYETMRFDADGNVGIGTTSPDEKLSVIGNTGLYGTVSGGIVSPASLKFFTSEDGAGLGDSTDSNKQNIGQITWTGKDTSQNATGEYAAIRTYIMDSNNLIQGSAGEGGQIEFSTFKHDVSTEARIERVAMTITPSALVGIGTTSPSSMLEIRKATATHQLVSLNRPDSDVAAMYLGNDSSSPANGVIASNYSDLILGRDQSGTLTEHVRIKRDGNVGIGTTDPGSKLTVSGSATGLFTNLLLSNTNDTDGDATGIGFSMLNNMTYVKGGIFFERTDTGGRGSIHIATTNTTDSTSVGLSDARLTVDKDGNVGIGTATPNAKLDVQGGNILAGGNIHIDNRGDFVTFYGDNSSNHSITSRDTDGNANDDIRINSYGNVLINLDSNNNNNNDAAFLIGRHGGGNGAMVNTGLFRVREDGLITANGVEVVKPLPGMYMGASSITDEYLVLMRKYPGTATNATGLLGKIVFQRGGTSAGNDLAEYEINMQTAYTNTAFWKFKRTGANVYTRIDEITIDGVSYYALRARSSGGGASLAHYFEGKILNGAGDSLLLTRVRESDANVTLVSAGVYYPDYETLSNNYMQGSLGVGASTPSKKFHVADSGNEVAYFQGTGNSAWIDIKGAASELWSIGATSVGYGIYNRTDSSYRFNIDNDGNVGIGTTSPDSFLQVKTHTHYDYVHDLHQKIATFNPSSMSGAGSNASVNIGNGSYGTSGTENLYLQFLNTHGNYGNPVGWRLKSYTDLDATGASSTFAIQQIRRGNSTSANDGTQPHIDTEFLIKQDGTIQFPQYGAGFLQTDASGNITAGAVTTSDTLDDVTNNGNSTTNSIVLGASTTGGTMLVRGTYTSGNIVVIGGMKSSGGAMIGYGVKPDTATNHGFVSSSAFTLERSAYYQQGNRHRWYAGASQDVAIGNAVTMSETMRLDFDKLGLSTSSPASLIHLGKPTNGSNIITFGEASIGGPHGLDFYGDDATRTKKYSIYYRTGTENISMETSDGTKRFEINQSGAVTLNEAFTFPTADGSAGAALVTNGSGSLSWNAGYQQYTPVGWGVLNNQTYTSTGSNISSNSTQAQAGTTPVQRNSATEFEATKAGWYEISYSFIVKNNYANRAMIGAYMTVSTSGGGGVISGSHSTQYVRYSTYGQYAQIQNTFYYYTSASSTNFYLLAYLLSGSMNMTTQAVSQSMISFRYINNDIT